MSSEGLRQVEVCVRVWAFRDTLQPTFHTRKVSSGLLEQEGKKHTACSHYTWRESLQEVTWLCLGRGLSQCWHLPSSVDSFGVFLSVAEFRCSGWRRKAHHPWSCTRCARMREQVWFLDLPGHYTPLFSCLIWTFRPQYSASH